jgi:hypothetical protein
MFHPDPTGSFQAFILEERHRRARQGLPAAGAKPANVFCPRRPIGAQFRSDIGSLLAAFGQRLIAGAARPMHIAALRE